jgi:hypothetical protein
LGAGGRRFDPGRPDQLGMKTLGKRLVVLGFFFLQAATAVLLIPAFREERNQLALGWWMSTSFLCGGALLMLGVHLWYKDGNRGA